MDIIVNKSTPLKGIIEIPSDKSITHRAFMFAALTKGKVKVKITKLLFEQQQV